MMKRILIVLILIATVLAACAPSVETLPGGNPNIVYFGRTDRSDSLHPKQWAAGGYFNVRFKGNYCVINISDEYYSDRRANLLEVAVDLISGTQVVITKDSVTNIVIGNAPQSVLDTLKGNVVKCFGDLHPNEYVATICRNTETAMGYTQVNWVSAPKILPCQPFNVYGTIEFIGNSITCGAEADTSLMPGSQYKWGDWHRAYYGYGPRTARNLGSAWSLVSVSGIGLIHSCCDMEVTMPQVYDKYILRNNQKPYKHELGTYLFCICLGQNDGIQDSTAFCDAYVDFVKQVVDFNMNGDMVTNWHVFLLTSPMADEPLREWPKKMLTAIEQRLQEVWPDRIHKYFFSRSWNSGGASHPSVEEHEQIANELTNFIQSILKK